MKHIALLISAFLITFNAFTQDLPIDSETNLITYTEVVEVPNVFKNDLYLRANTWLTRAFKGATKQVIELDDKEAGKLVGRGLIPMSIKLPLTGRTDAGSVSMTITILSKDGKYKYIIDNLTHEKPVDKDNWSSAGPLEQKKPKNDKLLMKSPSSYEWKEIKAATDGEIKRMVAELKKAMTKKDADF